MQKYEVSRTTPYLLMTPVISFALAAFVLGDEISWRILMGAALTMAGVALVALAERRLRRLRQVRQRCAGDARAGAADRLAGLIVGPGVDDEGRAVGVEQRRAARTAAAEVTEVVKNSAANGPAGAAKRLGRSPASGPPGFSRPCCDGLAAALVAAGGLKPSGEIAAIAAHVQMQPVPAGRQRTLRKLQPNQHASRRLP